MPWEPPPEIEDQLQAPSTTDREDMDKCPECGSVTVHSRGPDYDGPERFCRSCGADFDDPA